MPALLEAFIRMTVEEQAVVLSKIHPGVLGKLRIRFVSLQRAIQAVSEKINEFEKREKRETSQEETQEAPLAHEIPKLAATLVEVLPTAREIPVLAEVSAPTFDKQMSVKTEINKAAENGKTQSFAQSKKILGTLLFSGGIAHVNLSRARLQNALSAGSDVDAMVAIAVASAKKWWRQAPQGKNDQKEFIQLLAKIRHAYGNKNKIEDSLLIARKEDESKDPVSF